MQRRFSQKMIFSEYNFLIIFFIFLFLIFCHPEKHICPPHPHQKPAGVKSCQSGLSRSLSPPCPSRIQFAKIAPPPCPCTVHNCRFPPLQCKQVDLSQFGPFLHNSGSPPYNLHSYLLHILNIVQDSIIPLHKVFQQLCLATFSAA